MIFLIYGEICCTNVLIEMFVKSMENGEQGGSIAVYTLSSIVFYLTKMSFNSADQLQEKNNLPLNRGHINLSTKGDFDPQKN